MGRGVKGLQLIGMGWYIALCLVVGVVVGLWLDGWLGVAPLFLLVGLFLGLGCAVWGVYRMVTAVVETNGK